MWVWLQNKTRKFIRRHLDKSLVASICIHLFGFGLVYLELNPSRKRIEQPKAQKVVWTQTIVAKKKTPKDKLPPPDVKPKIKKEEPKKVKIEPKKEKPKEVKKPKKEEPKKSRQDQIKEALAKLAQQAPDDRPAPKKDNFETNPDAQEQAALTDAQIEGIKMSPAMAAYRDLIRTSIIDQFVWYKPKSNYQTTIELFILEDGSIENVKMVESSSNDAFDQATLRAVHRASPLVAPPAPLIPLMRQESVLINFDGSQL